MKTLVYIESTVNSAFQFITFDNSAQATIFANNINEGENTLRATVIKSISEPINL